MNAGASSTHPFIENNGRGKTNFRVLGGSPPIRQLLVEYDERLIDGLATTHPRPRNTPSPRGGVANRARYEFEGTGIKRSQSDPIVYAIYFLDTGTPLLISFYWTITCRTALWVRVPEVAVTVIV